MNREHGTELPPGLHLCQGAVVAANECDQVAQRGRASHSGGEAPQQRHAREDDDLGPQITQQRAMSDVSERKPGQSGLEGAQQ